VIDEFTAHNDSCLTMTKLMSIVISFNTCCDRVKWIFYWSYSIFDEITKDYAVMFHFVTQSSIIVYTISLRCTMYTNMIIS